MALTHDLERISALAGDLADDGERLAALLAAELERDRRVYVCAFSRESGGRSWVVLDDLGRPVRERRDVRAAVAITALCEIAADSAFPGDLRELRARLLELRDEQPDLPVDEVAHAAAELARVLGDPPQLATAERLDAIGSATRALEGALDPGAPSPFASAMRAATAAVEELQREVELRYRGALT